jgi:Asp-tRNA(Asn)/Glu-tRNA(Gln) amidotransferase A subunit family amidase
MARTIADVTLLFCVLSGRDDVDPVSAPVQFREVSLEDAKSIPIGWFEDDGITPVTEETQQAVRNAADALERRGFTVKRFRPASLEAARLLWWKFFVQCGAIFYGPAIRNREAELSPIFQEFLSISRAEPPLTADSLLSAWAECDGVRSRLLVEMEKCPVLLTPVCATPAFRHGEREWMIDGRRVLYLDAMRYTQWFNLLAAPAAVVPILRSADGLPIGVQIAGRPFSDELVLTVAAALESEFRFASPKMGMDV